MVYATAGLLSPSVFLIAIRACIQRDVQSVELRLLVRHLPYRALALVESSELKPNVGSARAIAVLRETALFVLANAHPPNLAARPRNGRDL